ncbi:MAG: DUF1565 domain-containing protein, partial [bacterium]
GVNGCISADPLFEYGVYLGAGSPCINAGTNNASNWGLGNPYTTRTDGSPDSGTVDMGYHYSTGLDAVAYADLYVKTNGDDSAVGTSWGSALKTLTNALARAGDVRRIYIAAGTYSTNTTEKFPLSIAYRSWIELLGAGSTSTVINAKNLTTNVFALSVVAKAKLADLTITGGNAASGGGVYIASCGDVLISGCNVTNNAGGRMGGGIYADYTYITVNDSLLAANSAAGGVNASGYGGAVCLTASRANVSNCIVRGNYSMGQNSGAGGYGGGIYMDASSTLTMQQSVLASNTANKNMSDTVGGGLCNAGVATLRNCLICTNRSTAVATKGDGIYSTGTSTLQNCTVANNRGEGLRVASGLASASNTIFWGNGDDLTGTVSVAYCAIGTADSFWTHGVNGCISNDPLFVDTTYFHEQSRVGHYTNGYFSGGGWAVALSNSPCIDAGDDSAWATEPEPNGRRINMGAYGNTSVASMGSSMQGTIFMLR